MARLSASPSGGRINLPNVITAVRIAVCPVLAWLALQPGAGARFGAFAVFVAAALSDVWDGHLARKHGWITDTGKLLDPIADKLLLVSTLIPFYMISNRPGPAGDVPWWGPLPIWVLVVIFGRELFMTLFRQWARSRDVVIAAGTSGKSKALFQSLFAGALLLWYPLSAAARAGGWTDHGAWPLWASFHGGFIAVTLAVALVLTVYSMIDYLWSYRSVVGVRD